MLSLDVMLCQDSRVEGRNLPSKPGMYVPRLLIFSKLSQYPPTVDDKDMETLEKFVVTMYDTGPVQLKVWMKPD